MRRYQPVEYADASQGVRAIYDDVRATLKSERLPNWIKAMGGNETLLRGNWEKTKASLVEGQIPHLLKELIIFAISTKRGAEYCSACHAHAALSLDPTLTLADLEALSAAGAYRTMPPAFQVAIDVVSRAAMAPNSITDDDFRRLEGAGFSADEIPELFAQADLAVMFNTITSALRLPLEPEYAGARLTRPTPSERQERPDRTS
jgi:alkylhydroperoxidase family enzyme